MSLDSALGMVLPSDAFPKASFDGFEFAYSEVTVKGGIRYAIHEFPHAAGGEPEKMGRKPYTISFRCTMQDIPGTDLAREYPDAYPNGLRILREKFEIQLTADLVIPTVGKIKAVATDWVQKFAAQSPSGESFDLEFLEDQEATFLAASNSGAAAAAVAIAEASDAAFAAAAIADFKKVATLGFFQQLNDLIVGVQGALEAGDAFGRVLEGKLQGLANLLSYADGQLEEMQHPSNHLVTTALKDVWLATTQLAENVTQSSQQLRTYTVPKLMTIGQVSTAVYGTSERGMEILDLNAVDDAFAIPAGKALKYVTG